MSSDSAGHATHSDRDALVQECAEELAAPRGEADRLVAGKAAARRIWMKSDLFITKLLSSASANLALSASSTVSRPERT